MWGRACLGWAASPKTFSPDVGLLDTTLFSKVFLREIYWTIQQPVDPSGYNGLRQYLRSRGDWYDSRCDAGAEAVDVEGGNSQAARVDHPEAAWPSAPAAQAQRAILGLILAQHPAQLTICELALEINESDDFESNDAVERAVRDLVGAGLLRCQGISVLPTRAALCFDQLQSK